MSLSKRLKEQRIKNKFSQQKMAELSNTHYSKIGRYERGDARPSSEVLNRNAQVLEVFPDYLINGTLENKASKTLTNQEQLNQFKKNENLSTDKKYR